MNSAASRRVLVTGGSSGLGAALTREFLDRGDRVLIAQTCIHLAFLLSAMAIAMADRLLPQPAKPH